MPVATLTENDQVDPVERIRIAACGRLAGVGDRGIHRQRQIQ
ncbi:MAG TPA: hypothetical protein VMV87_09640 [Burkholderiales bacterium]|nr:hypothetical protein [Burkholderiales bacterium]